MRPLVLDVSNNRTIRAEELRRTPAVALIAKATEGTSFLDSTYGAHRAAARGCRIVFGAYHFLHADSYGDQAEYFLRYAKPVRGDLQPIVDAETGMVAPEGKRAYACLSELDQRGYRPLLYSSWAYLREMIKAEPRLTRFRIWQANYGPVRFPVGLGASVVMWQFTETYPVALSRYDASRLLVPLDSLRI